MRTLQEHIDDLDRMVDTGTAVHKIRSQIAFIAREVAVLQADYDGLVAPSSLAQPEMPPLSDQAKRLLLEVELCDVSSPKGLSLLRVTETEGDYLPHLYNAQPPSQVRCFDLNEVIQAANNLVESGWLEPHAAEANVTEYRRTARSIPL